ncbi:MAG TPA: molybdopterin molybdotransferase MoeA [Spirochaetia bacterium]|nr:molybdopterin molybdotransferase MoeA [Spirochaetales bacterium]HRW23021.1 molybdopterin molybdotransferase MoeA [Spirochaetia bacterium]
MIHPDEAVAIMRAQRRDPPIEEVALRDALGRVLPREAVGRIDQPPFDKAAMDGWAWRPASGEAMPAEPLRARGVIAAGSGRIDGDRPDDPLGPGEAARIMTGAPLPPGASRVQRFEWAEEAGCLVRFTKAEGVDNVIRRGENARAGDIILTPRRLGAQDIAILAADGRDSVEVARSPVVGVLSTGTELAEPGQALSGAAIYDSNKSQLVAQLAGFDLRDLGRLPDDFDATLAAVSAALATCDVLVLSGGVSMGDFDYVPRALEAAGVREVFHGVAVKPGKPTYFGQAGGRYVLGLPGNPVSVFVNTETLVKELLYALSGAAYEPLYAPVAAAEDIRRKGTDRVEFLPVRIDADGVRPVRYGGSSGLQALAEAHGFVRLEIGQDAIAKGTVTRVRLVR